jgi:Leucine-rich repeat (LRR) protein
LKYAIFAFAFFAACVSVRADEMDDAVAAVRGAYGLVFGEPGSGGKPPLTSVVLNRCKNPDPVLKVLRGFKDLRLLELTGSNVSNAALQDLDIHKGLIKLTLYNTGVGDDGMKVMRNFPHLELLNLRATRVTAAGLRELNGLKSLQVIHLDPEQVNDDVLKALREVGLLHCLSMAAGPGEPRPRTDTDVTRLTLLGTRVTATGLKELQPFRNLEYLWLDDACMNPEAIGELGAFKKLNRLEVPRARLTDDIVHTLAKMKLLHTVALPINARQPATDLASLTVLDLSNSRLTDASLKAFAAAKNVQTLNLIRVPLTDAAAKDIVAFAELRSIDLFATGLTDAGFKELTKLSNLQRINLRATKVTDAVFEDLGNFKDLRSFEVNESLITDKAIRTMRKQGRLHTLQIAHNWHGQERPQGPKDVNYVGLLGTRISDAALKDLDQFENLLSLDLSGTAVTGGGLKDVKHLAKLNDLHLTRSHVTDAGLAGLKGLNVGSLSIEGCAITDAGLKELLAVPSIRSLNLAGTQITDAGLKELSGLPNLRHVSLASTSVTDNGLKNLAACKNLTGLNLGRTKITPAGLKELHALQGLTELTITRTKEWVPAINALKKALPNLRISARQF